jgi:hypothetical protein
MIQCFSPRGIERSQEETHVDTAAEASTAAARAGAFEASAARCPCTGDVIADDCAATWRPSAKPMVA